MIPQRRVANTWLEWNGSWELDAVYLGVPFDGVGTVRSGSRHAPAEVRRALPFYTAYSTTDGVDISNLRAVDIGDVQSIVTDMETTYANKRTTTAFLLEKGIKLAIIGGDNSISYATVRGVCDGMPGRVDVISNVQVWELGIKRVVKRTLARAERADAIYISIDVDGVDQSSAPGTAAPNPFGIDGRDVMMAVRMIAQHPKRVGMEITELSPPLDTNNKTSNWAAVAFMNFFYDIALQKERETMEVPKD